MLAVSSNEVHVLAKWKVTKNVSDIIEEVVGLIRHITPSPLYIFLAIFCMYRPQTIRFIFNMFVVARLFIFDDPTPLPYLLKSKSTMRDLFNENVQEGKIIINIRLSSLPNRTYWQPLNFISN